MQFQSTPDLINRENPPLRPLEGAQGTFQSTPDLINRENTNYPHLIIALKMFQSTPDLINRENFLRAQDLEVAVCFNPLPI